MIVGARFKAERRQAISAGWYAAAFARQKTMKPLEELLAPPRKGSGNSRALAMFRRQAALQKQGKTNGTG